MLKILNGFSGKIYKWQTCGSKINHTMVRFIKFYNMKATYPMYSLFSILNVNLQCK